MYIVKNPNKENDYKEVRKLLLEYQSELGQDLCFQDFQDELDSLPGKYKEPEGVILLLTDNIDRKTVGCVALRKFRDNICEMKRLYVKPEYRKKRYGEVLVDEIINIAIERGYERMVLDTLEELKPAIHLYKKKGFCIIDPYYKNPLKGVVYMEKTLSSFS